MNYSMGMSQQTFTETEQFITVNNETIDTTTLSPANHAKGSILFLHGAGESSKQRCISLLRALADRGWRCLTFSLPGHGQSSGSLLGSTLQGRKEISQTVARQMGFWKPDMIIGVSMGAHTAISLLADDPEACKKVVLMVAGSYAREAEAVAFGPEFTKILRRNKSYHSAHSWETLPHYKGELATIEAGKDEVIPKDVYDLIHNHASATITKHRVLIRDATHKISFWLADDPTRVELLANAIDNFDFSEFEQFS